MRFVCWKVDVTRSSPNMKVMSIMMVWSVIICNKYVGVKFLIIFNFTYFNLKWKQESQDYINKIKVYINFDKSPQNCVIHYFENLIFVSNCD